MRVIELKEHSPRWRARFLEEKDILWCAAGSVALAVHHIGSTAIPGIKSKDTVDILFEVRSIRQLQDLNLQMEAAGYISQGEFGIKGREFYIKGEKKRVVHLHAFEACHPEIERHILFVEYLRQYPERARQYQVVKQQAQAAHSACPERYTDAKAAIIRQIDTEAQEWKKQLRNL